MKFNEVQFELTLDRAYSFRDYGPEKQLPMRSNSASHRCLACCSSRTMICMNVIS